MRGLLRAERIRCLSILSLAIAVFLGTVALPSDVEAEEIAKVPDAPLAPTAAGAPFLPDDERATTLVERADLLVRRDSVDVAQLALAVRPGAGDTSRILDSQAAALDRALDDLEVEGFSSATAEFGIDVGVFPVAELRKPFRNDWGEPRSGGRRHRGTDLLAQTGVPLMAIEDGTFERTTFGALGGLSVYLLGDSGSRYYYAHLDEAVAMTEGQRVYAGEVIGTVGDSGNATGSPHLHLQWAPDGDSNWQNPYPLLHALYGEGSFEDPQAYGPPNAPR